jgi:transposase-like protein
MAFSIHVIETPSRELGSWLLGAFLTMFLGGLALGGIWLGLLSRPTCPKCNQYSTPMVIKSQLVAQEPGYKTVWRRLYDIKDGSTKLYQEQIHVIRNVYENRYRCEVCGAEWEEQSVTTLEG